MLAAIACLIVSLIWAKRESLTNILNFVLFKYVTPVWILSLTAWTYFVSGVGSSENLTSLIISWYLHDKSLLSGGYSARWTLALAIGSKCDGLEIEPKVPPNGMNKNCSIMKEKAEAISGDIWNV